MTQRDKDDLEVLLYAYACSIFIVVAVSVALWWLLKKLWGLG